MSNGTATKKHKQPESYRLRLLEIRESVLGSLGTKASALLREERVCEGDQAQHSLADAISLRLNGFDYLQLRQIREALDRLDVGGFGMCMSCEQPIAPKRLRALPWAKYCIACQDGVGEDALGGDQVTE
jgi:DnaK suppressor protein